MAYNLVLEHLDDFRRGGRIDEQRVHAHARDLIDRFDIRARPDDPVATLSGGNIQKVLLARVLSRDPRVLVVSQPTRGLDVGATEYVRSQLLARRAEGAAIVLVSEDLDELFALSDRLVVLYEGRVVGEMATSRSRSRAARHAHGRPGKGGLMRLSVWSTPVLAVIAIGVTFVITAVPILLAGANPIEAYVAFVITPLTSSFTLLEVLVSATPILFTGAAVAIAFRAGYWNIGAEGQLLSGAIAAAGIGTVVGGLPPLVALPVMVVGGALAGAAWALLPALLRVRFGIDEVVTTLLLNPVALLLVNGLLHGPWRDPVTGFPESPRIAASAEFPALIERSRLHLGFLLAAGRHRRRLVRARTHPDRSAAASRWPEPAGSSLRRHQRLAHADRRRPGQRGHRGHRGRQRGGRHPEPAHRWPVARLRLYRASWSPPWGR